MPGWGSPSRRAACMTTLTTPPEAVKTATDDPLPEAATYWQPRIPITASDRPPSTVVAGPTGSPRTRLASSAVTSVLGSTLGPAAMASTGTAPAAVASTGTAPAAVAAEGAGPEGVGAEGAGPEGVGAAGT